MATSIKIRNLFFIERWSLIYVPMSTERSRVEIPVDTFREAQFFEGLLLEFDEPESPLRHFPLLLNLSQTSSAFYFEEICRRHPFLLLRYFLTHNAALLAGGYEIVLFFKPPVYFNLYLWGSSCFVHARKILR